jgi:plastocyanin
VKTAAISGLLPIACLLAGCSGSPTKEPERAAKEAPPPVYTKVDPSTAGVLTGKITFKGKPPARKTIDLDQDPSCVKAHGKRLVSDESAVVNRDGTLANVFVYIKSGLEGKQFEAASEPVTIDQKGCWFSPRVVGIQTGQTLNVTNSDPLTHNIHPMAQVNREWNQSQSEGALPLKRRFVRPEIMIPVKCNIHGWMRSFIGVVDHPYFAVTDSKGSFEIKNLPPGQYVVAAWQERFGTKEEPVTLAPSGRATAAFTFTGD